MLCGRLNPEEYFNGWIKARIQEDVNIGVGSLADPIRTIYNAIATRMPRINQLSTRWVTKLYN